MHIIYLDESGTQAEARHFVVAGLSYFERQLHHVAGELDRIQRQYLPDATEPVEFHASVLRARGEHVRAPLDVLSRDERFGVLDAVYDALIASEPRLFAVAMEKAFILESDDEPYGHGFEQIVNRFDRMIARVNRDRDEGNRGLVVIAESSYRRNIEALARRIRAEGHRWGQLRHVTDIPYFAPAADTRMLQLADFVANAVYSRYEHGNARQFDRLLPLFDQDGAQMHGLVHLSSRPLDCYCPACITRRSTRMGTGRPR